MTLRRPAAILILCACALLVLLAVAQVVLPGVAADRLRRHLGREASVRSVSVRAFPAVELLWGHADAVSVHLASLTATRPRTGSLLAQAHAAGRLDVQIDTLHEGPLTLDHVSLRKRGDRLDGQAGVTRAALAGALPAGFSVQPVAAANGSLLLRAQVGVLGVGLAVDALLSARDGALVVDPVGVPFGSLIRLTVFSDPHVAVESVGAQARTDGYLLTASGRLL